jgi:ATP-binding cassette subfamily C protein LapB
MMTIVKDLLGEVLNNRRVSDIWISTVTINVLALASSFYSIHLLNRYVTVGLTPTLVTLTVGVILSIIFEVLMRKQRQKVLLSISREGEEKTNSRVFESLARARFEPLSLVPLPIKREAMGAPMMQQQMASISNLGAILDLPFALLFLLAATLLYWPLGLIGLAMSAWALWLGYANEKNQRHAADEHAKSNSKNHQLGQFLLSAGEALRCLPMRLPLTRRWSEVGASSLGSRREGMVIQSDLQTTIQMMNQCLTVLVYSVGAMAVVRGDFTTGGLIGANILIARAFGACSRAAYLSDAILRAQRAEDALRQLEALEQETSDGNGVSPKALLGHLELVDAAFFYPNQPVPLFERLDIALKPGQVMVITGPNGSGKSSLIKVMLGLLSPKRGLVRADSIELRQLSQEWWRSQIGYAPQEPVFFDGTLRENLLLDRPVVDDEVIEWVKAMGLEGFLANDPAGLDRQIVGQDTGMAVGLRRRFVLIRAVLGNAPVLFLDDPTEGLDQQGQSAVAKLLNRLVSEGKTLVVASNEPFIFRAADVVIDMGQKPVPKVAYVKREGGNKSAAGLPSPSGSNAQQGESI